MAHFTVLAVDSFAGEVRSIDTFECYGISEAHRKAGELAAHRTGVIILDEHDDVWFEFRPSQIEKMTSEQRIFYRHYQPRVWEPHLDYAGEPMQPGEFRDPPQEAA